MIGCIIPESGTNHRIINAKEYNGRGVSGTDGWNCGEGLVQWTYWKYKLPLIKKYNEDPRSTQKLPTDWETYRHGTPIKQGNQLVSPEDGLHIAGLTLDNQMLFLSIYYADLINELRNETNLAVITAKIYQKKAGIGFYKNISDPVERAYTTSKNKYPSSAGNHYLQSLSIAQQYTGAPVAPYTADAIVPDVYYASNDTQKSTQKSTQTNRQSASSNNVNTTPNQVYMLSSATKKNDNILKQSDDRKSEFSSLQNAMASNTPQMGREIYLTEDMYDSNILKGSQESKKEMV